MLSSRRQASSRRGCVSGYNSPVDTNQTLYPFATFIITTGRARKNHFMNVFYEEEGTFKVGAVLADNTTSLQVEAPHGKRAKIKAASVLLRFDAPSLSEFMDLAQKTAEVWIRIFFGSAARARPSLPAMCWPRIILVTQPPLRKQRLY